MLFPQKCSAKSFKICKTITNALPEKALESPGLTNRTKPCSFLPRSCHRFAMKDANSRAFDWSLGPGKESPIHSCSETLYIRSVDLNHIPIVRSIGFWRMYSAGAILISSEASTFDQNYATTSGTPTALQT